MVTIQLVRTSASWNGSHDTTTINCGTTGRAFNSSLGPFLNVRKSHFAAHGDGTGCQFPAETGNGGPKTLKTKGNKGNLTLGVLTPQVIRTLLRAEKNTGISNFGGSPTALESITTQLFQPKEI